MSNWTLASAAVQGLDHLAKGTPCQDKVAAVQRNDVSVICLADGAGSAALSHFGAQAIVECIVDYLCDDFDLVFSSDEATTKDLIASKVIGCLGETSQHHNCAFNDLASTLLVVAVKHKKSLAVHVGDGVIGGLCGRRLTVVSRPQNGEFANVTFFTTSSRLTEHMRVVKADARKYSGYVLMSDGTEQSLYNKKKRALCLRRDLAVGNPRYAD